MIFKDGKLVSVEEEDVTIFLSKMLTFTGLVKLLREEEAYEEEFMNIPTVIEKIMEESLGKELDAKVEINGRVYTIIAKNGKIIYSDVDPSYKGRVKLIEVIEKED